MMPKACAMNIVMAMKSGRKPKAGWVARMATRQWEKLAMQKQQRERTREQEQKMWCRLNVPRTTEEQQAVATLGDPSRLSPTLSLSAAGAGVKEWSAALE